MTTKILWSVGLPDPDALLLHAQKMGMAGVCIRSSNANLPGAIEKFHDAGIAVYAWRWPAVQAQPGSSTHYYAIDEATYVAETLIPLKLDGYIVDAESDPGSDVNDWNSAALAGLAGQFCSIITTAAEMAGLADFRFGLTSGCNYPSAAGRPNIPWKEFSATADTLYPQCYWRWTNPTTGKPQNINGGTPSAAIKTGLAAWNPISGGKPVIPMAGELNLLTPDELSAYATAVLGIASELHFYTDDPSLSDATMELINSLEQNVNDSIA